MKFYFFPLICALAALPFTAIIARAQAASDNYFPTDSEFPDLHRNSDIVIEDPSGLSKLADGRLFESVGFEKYAKRTYSSGNSGSLSVEVVSLRDFRAAYSLLTLIRDSNTQIGPPGDAFTMAADGIRFVKKREWVRIQAAGMQDYLLKRVAISISNRLGQDKQGIPSLVSHLPKLGFDASSLRYFPGMKSFETYSGKAAGTLLKLDSDMEIVQARYSLENQTGDLILLSFPTTQAADECFTELTDSKPVENNENRTYAKRVGPIVALLEGAFDPAWANKILSPIKHRYSIRWILENKPTTIWGVPVGILGTVVKSFLFVVLLCVVSIVAGAGLAVFRFVLRGYASHNILDRQSEITRLRLR
jgi:hypothetical protein